MLCSLSELDIPDVDCTVGWQGRVRYPVLARWWHFMINFVVCTGLFISCLCRMVIRSIGVRCRNEFVNRGTPDRREVRRRSAAFLTGSHCQGSGGLRRGDAYEVSPRGASLRSTTTWASPAWSAMSLWTRGAICLRYPAT